jgi:hypothetical protein
MQSLRKVYANIMQSLCKVYTKFMHTCSQPAATAHEFLQPTSPALGTIVVVGPTNTSVRFSPVAALTRLIILVLVRRSALFTMVEPLHKLSLHHGGQSDTSTASNSHKCLVVEPPVWSRKYLV